MTRESTTMKTLTHFEGAKEFSAKRILVTGGTKGIGEAIVKRLQAGGGNVLTTARSIPSGGKRSTSFKPTSAHDLERTTSSRVSWTGSAVSTFLLMLWAEVLHPAGGRWH